MAIDRRREEIDALLAYYGEENVSSSLVTALPLALPSPGGPSWFLRLVPPGEEPCAAAVAVPTLEIQLQATDNYPFGDSPPTPVLHNFTLSPSARAGERVCHNHLNS